MRISTHHAYISFFISALAIPALVFGATPSPAPSPIVALDTTTASNLLNRVQVEAYRVNNEADQLFTFYRTDIGWYGDSTEIGQMADRVRKMDRDLYQLRNMQNEVAAPQSRVISRITPDIILLTDELNTSIHYLNHNQERLWVPQWRDDVTEMLHTSAHIKKDMKNLKQIIEEANLNPAHAKGSIASS